MGIQFCGRSNCCTECRDFFSIIFTENKIQLGLERCIKQKRTVFLLKFTPLGKIETKLVPEQIGKFQFYCVRCIGHSDHSITEIGKNWNEWYFVYSHISNKNLYLHCKIIQIMTHLTICRPKNLNILAISVSSVASNFESSYGQPSHRRVVAMVVWVALSLFVMVVMFWWQSFNPGMYESNIYFRLFSCESWILPPLKINYFLETKRNQLNWFFYLP